MLCVADGATTPLLVLIISRCAWAVDCSCQFHVNCVGCWRNQPLLHLHSPASCSGEVAKSKFDPRYTISEVRQLQYLLESPLV